jgi:hypothetical protein
MVRNILALLVRVTHQTPTMGDKRNTHKPKLHINAVAGPLPLLPPQPRPKPRKKQPEAPSQDQVSIVIPRLPLLKTKPDCVDSQSIIQDILSRRSGKMASALVSNPDIGSSEDFKFDGLSDDNEDEEEIDENDEPVPPCKASKKPQSKVAGTGTFIPFYSFPHVSYSMHSQAPKIVRNSF